MIKPKFLRNIIGFLLVNAGIAMMIFALAFGRNLSTAVGVVGFMYGFVITLLAGNGLANEM